MLRGDNFVSFPGSCLCLLGRWPRLCLQGLGPHSHQPHGAVPVPRALPVVGDNQRCPLLGGDSAMALGMCWQSHHTQHQRIQVLPSPRSSCQDPTFPSWKWSRLVSPAGDSVTHPSFPFPGCSIHHGQVKSWLLIPSQMLGMFCPFPGFGKGFRNSTGVCKTDFQRVLAGRAGSRVCRNGVGEMES